MIPGPFENEQQHNDNEESVVDKTQIQQWVDRAIGNLPQTGRIENPSWPPRPTTTTAAAATTFSVSYQQNLTPNVVGKSHEPSSSSSSLLTAIIENPHTTQTDFDKAFAAELNQLTFQEREKTLDEIHGVAPIQEETPDFVHPSW